MKGTSGVIAALQEAINLEATAANAYLVNGKDQQRRGMKTGDELLELKDQCCKFQKMLIKHLLFFDEKVELSPDPVTVGDAFDTTLDELIAMEMNIVERYTAAMKLCYTEGDGSNHHLFQHLLRWHREGQREYTGHLKYLEHERWQFAKLGEVDYIAAHI
jgi:bacterioferritin (cytochrome b1)